MHEVLVRSIFERTILCSLFVPFAPLRDYRDPNPCFLIQNTAGRVRLYVEPTILVYFLDHAIITIEVLG